MKKSILLLLLYLFITPVLSTANTIHNIVAFGDSLSDTGNLYDYTGHSIPPSPPYSEGRFSNGPIWIEQLLSHYTGENSASRLDNYAFGGAGVATDDGVYFSLQSELDNYLAAHAGKASTDTLYTVWIGSNNYIGMLEEEDPASLSEELASDVTSAIASSLRKLANAGAQSILVLNLPDIGKTPAYRNDPEFAHILSTTVLQHNQKLEAVLAELQIEFPHTQWIRVDAYEAFEQAIRNPSYYGFENISDACLDVSPMKRSDRHTMLRWIAPPQSLATQTACDRFVFFDSLHPTMPVHTILSDMAQAAIEKTNIVWQ